MPARELDELARKDPAHADPAHLSKDFGLPHLAIAQSNSCVLLNLGIFPASGAFDGRLFGESWESSNLYWARLADEMGYSPAMLNVLVPNLTRRMVANIFATNIDDWPALLRAMEKTGDEFRQSKLNGRGTGTMTGQVGSYPTATLQTVAAKQADPGGPNAMIHLRRTLRLPSNVCAALFLLIAAAPRPSAQDETSRFRVNVVLVQLTVAVTDSKGNYVTGLRPEDFSITEDNIPQKIATFEEGSNELVREQSMPAHPDESDSDSVLDVTPPAVTEPAPELPAPVHTLAGKTIPGFGGANVYILFDTSNYMYRGFVFAQDAIADFVRAMPDANKIAFYSYSRDLSRSATLTTDRFQVVNGVRNTVAGDDAALYNSLLLTVKDAAPLQGRKAIVVFSNGPDNASSVPPEDVAELAQSTGTIIYIVSTRQAESEPVSSACL